MVFNTTDLKLCAELQLKKENAKVAYADKRMTQEQYLAYVKELYEEQKRRDIAVCRDMEDLLDGEK